MVVETVSLVVPEFSAAGSAALVSAILWFRGHWVSALVIEVVAGPPLRWLLTVGLIFLIFLTFFLAILSGLSLARRAPAELWFMPHTYSVSLVYLVVLHPVVSTLHPFSLHKGWGTCGPRPRSEGGTVARPVVGRRCGAWPSEALSDLWFCTPLCSGSSAGNCGRPLRRTAAGCLAPAAYFLRACDICGLCPLLLQQHRTLQPVHLLGCEGISWGYSFCGSLGYKSIFLRVVPVAETTPVSYMEPFFCSQNLCFEMAFMSLLPGRCSLRPTVVPGLVSTVLRVGAAGREWWLGWQGAAGSRLTAHGFGDGDWGRWGSPGSSRAVMVTRLSSAAVGLLRALWGRPSTPATDRTSFHLLMDTTFAPASWLL